MPKVKSKSSNRSIHFYRAHAGLDASGKPIALDFPTALQAVNMLPFKGDANTSLTRYQQIDDDSDLCMWVETDTRFQLATIRRGDLPHIEDAGTLSSLNLRDRQGLAEFSHFMIFPNNLVGIVFNFYGPRSSRLSPYFQYSVPSSIQNFILNPLIRQDALAQLEQLEELRSITLTIWPSYASIVQQADESLGRAFEAATLATNPQELTFVLSVDSRRKGRKLKSSILMRQTSDRRVSG